MRILYLCHRFPYPPRHGGNIRSFNMIRYLGRRHRVTVASLARSPAQAAEGAGIAGFCDDYEVVRVNDILQTLRMVALVPTHTPSSFGFFHSDGLKRRIRRRLRETRYDLILVHSSSAAPYVARVRGIPKILDFCDMDSQKWLEYARHLPVPLNACYWYEGRKLWLEERRLAQQFDFCTVATRAEHETLSALGAGTPTGWFSNGVDSDYFAPTGEPYDPDTICFMGRMDYYPNRECMSAFCAQVWPALRARRPRLRLLIVGADPSPAVRRLGRLPGVTVTGAVPDVRPYVRGCALTVAPLNIARGTQNKILESMALAVPVVASRIAAAGVDAAAGEHLLVADTPQDYVEAILRVLDDREARSRLGVAGRERMLSHHAWDACLQRLDGILERCLTRYEAAQARAALA